MCVFKLKVVILQFYLEMALSEPNSNTPSPYFDLNFPSFRLLPTERRRLVHVKSFFKLFLLVLQLMGMWYGIEIISHRHDSPSETEYSADCPVIYFFEEKNRTSSPSLYEGVQYGQTYGTPMYDTNYQEKYRQQQQYQQQGIRIN